MILSPCLIIIKGLYIGLFYYMPASFCDTLWFEFFFFFKKRIHIRILTICHFLSSLNATDFLERLRGKKLVFVGDSLNRNMWESLVCILRNSIRNKKRVYEISGRREFKKKGFYAFIFEASFRRVLHLWLEEFSFFFLFF